MGETFLPFVKSASARTGARHWSIPEKQALGVRSGIRLTSRKVAAWFVGQPHRAQRMSAPPPSFEPINR